MSTKSTTTATAPAAKSGQSIALHQQFSLRVNDVSSPCGESFIPVEVTAVEGGMVRVSAIYCEALTLAPKYPINPKLLIARGDVREGWIQPEGK